MSKKIDQCDLCGGELKAGITILDIWYNSELIIIQDIPADVCDQCGEAYLRAEISEKLDQFFEEYHTHKPERYIKVPQFSAKEAIGTLKH
jgi:YgiT-type zinc finger domain-containing protein